MKDIRTQQVEHAKLMANNIKETDPHKVLPNHPSVPTRLNSNHEELNFPAQPEPKPSEADSKSETTPTSQEVTHE